MKYADPLFSYLTILAIIQPARIQDVENSASSYFKPELAEWLRANERLRGAHESARARNFVIQVRRGVYFLTPSGRAVVRRSLLERSIDNRRLFLMKAQRKRYR